MGETDARKIDDAAPDAGAHLEPFPIFEIAGERFRAGPLSPERLNQCHIIGEALRNGVYGDDETIHAVATIIAALVAPNRLVRPRDLIGHLTYRHFEQAANELARQLLATVPVQGRA